MTWETRLRAPKYTSPSGAEFEFIFEDVTKTTPRKTAVFEFPDVDATYVQDLGRAGRRVPLRLIFSGADYDQDAARFDDALNERGRGRLEHPIYGVLDVVPSGEITRRDDLKTAANQAVYEITFIESIVDLFPEAQTDSDAALSATLEEQTTGAADQLNQDADTSSPSALASIKSAATGALDAVKAGVQTVANTQEDIARQFQTVADVIDNTLDTLVRDPIALATEFDRLLRLPAQTVATIEARLDGYGNIIAGFTGSDRSPTNDSEALNAFAQNLQVADASMSAAMRSTLNTTFTTRAQAINTSEKLIDQFDDLNDWRDRNSDILGRIDTGESYQPLQKALSIAVGALISEAFGLPTQVTIVLDAPRTPLDLVAELYGELDTKLDFFIETNNFAGDELFEIPQGRSVVYFRD